MGKRVLVSAGPVYGALDENKVVSNRSRGLWALKFASWLAAEGYEVTLLVPDLMPLEVRQVQGILVPPEGAETIETPNVKVIHHNGFNSYRDICTDLAPKVDSMILAAAVVNWIPKKPFPGKMPTKNFLPGSIISIPFTLAPRVIGEMKRLNPKLTLIGCKLTVGATEEELIDAAYENVLLSAHCNVVVANDLNNLKTKLLVYPDRSVHRYESNFEGLFRELRAIVEDEYWTTTQTGRSPEPGVLAEACTRFDHIVTEYRGRFVSSNRRVFGSLAVRVPYSGWLVSPREKDKNFTAADAVFVDRIDETTHVVYTSGGKATLNAPLLIRMGTHFNAPVVLHLHEKLEQTPSTVVVEVPYAPPGTVRDNNREIPSSPEFNTRAHGFVKCIWDR